MWSKPEPHTKYSQNSIPTGDRNEVQEAQIIQSAEPGAGLQNRGGKGRELGVATPITEQLTHMVGEIEHGKRQIDLRNFREISFK